MAQDARGSQAEIIEWLMANDLLEHEGTPGLIKLAQVGNVVDQAFARTFLLIHSRARGSVDKWILARTTADTSDEEGLHAADESSRASHFPGSIYLQQPLSSEEERKGNMDGLPA